MSRRKLEIPEVVQTDFSVFAVRQLRDAAYKLHRGQVKT